MNQSLIMDARPPLSEGEKGALITLLADEDPAVYQAVRSKVVSYGNQAGEWLRPHTLSNDPVVRGRVREILRFLEGESAHEQFLSFCRQRGEIFDLEEAVFLLARTKYPEINPEGYRALLDHFAVELRGRIQTGGDAEPVLACINEYLYEEHGFYGNEEDYYNPANSYLNRVLDTRTGNPISLCLVYYFVARRLKLPVVGIGMPGHFVLRYQGSKRELFIDAFNQGKLLSKADCVQYLTLTSGFHESYLGPVTSRRVLLRICSNLHQIYSDMEEEKEAERLQRYIIALAK